MDTVEAGWNSLVDCKPEWIVRVAMDAQPGVESTWPYGDGKAGVTFIWRQYWRHRWLLALHFKKDSSEPL